VRLKGKLKVARPQHISQKNGAISKFKNTLSEQIKTLRYKALNQFKDKYKKVSFW
jgi:hypothetical protein